MNDNQQREMNEKLGELFKNLCGVVWQSFKLAYGYVATGYVITVVWGWFIVEHYGLDPLTIPMAIGLLILCRLFTSSSSTLGQTFLIWKERDKDNEIPGGLKMASALGPFFYPWIFYIAAWITKTYFLVAS